MDLKKYYEIITKLWNLIKKYHDHLNEDDDWEAFANEIDQAWNEADPDARRLTLKLMMTYAGHEEEIYMRRKVNGNEQQADERRKA